MDGHMSLTIAYRQKDAILTVSPQTASGAGIKSGAAALHYDEIQRLTRFHRMRNFLF
jgi:hypothetical protein